LRGRVVTPEGKPAPNLSVFTRENFNYDHKLATDLKWPRIRTDADGRFELNEVDADQQLTIYTPKEYAPVQDFLVELEGNETEVTIEMQPAGIIRARAIDEETGELIPAFNVRVDRVDEPVLRAGDTVPLGIFASHMNPGINVHGTAKEFVLDGQTPGMVYRLIISADGYETTEVDRARAEVDAELVDVPLTRKK